MHTHINQPLLIATTTTIFSIVIVILGQTVLNIGFTILALTIILLFGSIVFMNSISQSSLLDMGEFRKAITLTFIVVYICFLTFSLFPGKNTINAELAEKVNSRLSYLVGMMITYYFASRAIKDYKNGTEKPETEN